ncbi:helix-hairpin-helix domain-containing protein [Laspinema olomoucense]|uniref:Protein kinase domain-containing protein n=1 Tax=Laspinema olomoucense D3b TaxID=2953688 RepID=A0ABT2NA71_9CYAN|nr:hypothetical protein [Laspinema sp. D3b]MCT7979600.1 hypothetical protein [Laspinema sp. D3b]
MINYHDSKGKSVTLIKLLAKSGEGEIWTTNRKGLLAKIYHSPNSVRRNKVEAMIANPPKDPTKIQNHISIVWPKDLLLKTSGSSFVGFLMPYIVNSKELLCIYNPKLRKKQAPRVNWYGLHIIAKNVASILQALHAKNYIIGDMKSQNILVNERGQVSIIDTDSFQITDPQGKVYRCSVGSEGFTPPELIAKELSTMTQNRFHDRFRLAVIIHYLLFGYHPFMGRWIGIGDPPGLDESISKGYWPYGLNSKFTPSQNTIPLHVVHPEIKKCFLKCFNEGHTSPSSRPSPQDWVNALEQGISDLETCRKVGNHSYSITYGRCYWCERANHLGTDIFPSVTNPIKPPKSNQKISSLLRRLPPLPRLQPLPQLRLLQRLPPLPPLPQQLYLKVTWKSGLVVTLLILIIGWQLNVFGLKNEICTEWGNNLPEKLCR